MMNKNGIYFVVSVVWATLVLIGCSRFQEEDLFEESAAMRVVHFNEQLQSRLVTQSSEENNGWVIQFFVGGSFEGFNLYGRFYDNGKVTLAGNHRFLRNDNANKYTESTSFYEMLREEGPVLAFNTWNDVLTVFVDPVDPASAPKDLKNDGEGMSGDQNLVFESFDGNDIVFHGERNSAKVRFIPCDRPWKSYIEDTEAMKNYITNSTITSYYVVSGTDTLYFKNLHKGIFTYCERINDPRYASTLKCVFTPAGFSLQRKNNIQGTSFREFRLAEDKTHLISENDSVQVIPTWDNYIVNVRMRSSASTCWNFDQDKFSGEQKSLLKLMEAEVNKFDPKNTYSVDKIGLGHSSGKNPIDGLVFMFKAKSKTINAGLSLTISRPDFGQMKISYSDQEMADGNLTNMSKKCDIEPLVRQFAATLSGTYDIVPDDYFLPTGCELHAVGGGNEYILK